MALQFEFCRTYPGRPKVTKAFFSCLAAGIVLASVAACHAQSQYVEPVDWSRYSGMMGVKPGDAFGQKVATLMQKQSAYLLGWVNSQCAQTSSGGQLSYVPRWDLDDGSAICSLTQFVRTNVQMIQTGVYSQAASGISMTEALNRTQMAIRGVALTHVVNKTSGNNWGNDWQTAYWASQLGEAAWMDWGNLSSSTREATAKVVEYEANRFLNYTVPYTWTRNGSLAYSGDTKAEENAWNARVLTVAQAMMPDHPNAAQWRTKASELMVGSYCRPSDVNNTTMVDGKQVKQWINGYNLFQDGVAVNHHIVHPDYDLTVLNYMSTVTCSLAGQYVPQSVYFGSDTVYNALTGVYLVPGASPYGTPSIQSPGGTMYRKSVVNGVTVYDPKVFFPNGTDWSLVRYENYSTEDIFAELLGLDVGKNFDAMGWANAHVDAMLALQARAGHTGNLYQSGDWITDLYNKETEAYQAIGVDWMTWWLMQNGQVSPVGDHWGAVPEPGVFTLLGIGLTSLLAYAWRRNKVRSRT
jgi:hypothetical protein